MENSKIDPSAIDFAQVSPSCFPPLPTAISTHFDLDTNHRPIYSKQNEFVGGPEIIVDEVTSKSRPLEQRDYQKKPFPASESRDSEEVSSVHKVPDLGFSAAAGSFPNSIHNFSNSETLKRDALNALEVHRGSHRPSVSEHPTSCMCVESGLRKKVEKGLDWSAFDKKEYLPLDVLEKAFDVKSLISLLAERYPQMTNENLWTKFTEIFSPSTRKSRRRILGILVFMKGFVLIKDFIREDIWDENLPLKYRESRSQTPPLMKDWDRNDIDLFYHYQKMFFVPFFNIQDQRPLSYDLDREIRLPWQKFEYKTSGGTGIIHRVEIHPSHHNFRRPENMKPVFALKEFDAKDQKTYNEELFALERICAQVQREKHLIKLLLTFRHGEKFYLLFEWADGNLERFWESETIKLSTPLIERWAAEQCLGLARAVSRIHGLRTWQKRERSSSTDALFDDERAWGRHGDIKPDNILWFREYEGDRNLLVISDLGLTRYHTRFSRSLVHRSQIDGCTRAYRPPELDMGSGISQLYDIWSLGCVFLEFCIWYLQGHDEVHLFASERMSDDKSPIDNVKEDEFFLINGIFNDRTPDLKPSVKKRIAMLRDKSTAFTNGLLDVIEGKMLRCDPRNRSRIDQICTDLLNVLNSLPKAATTVEEISQAGAFAGRGESVLYPPSLSDISQDESSNWTLESPGTSMMNGRDTAVAVSARSGASTQEEIEQDNHHDDIEISKVDLEVVALKAIRQNTATIQQMPPTDSSETAAQPETTQITSTNISVQTVSDQRSPPAKTKRHRRNKSSKFIKGAWNAIRIWKQ